MLRAQKLTCLVSATLLVTGSAAPGRRATASVNPGHHRAAAGAGTWTMTGSMSLQRDGFVAVTLADGRVLVLGGVVQGGVAQNDKAEIYTGATGEFRVVSAPPLFQHGNALTATLLRDGRVLFAGGAGARSSAELFDPATETFSATAAMNSLHVGHTAVLLKDGRVLIASGYAADFDQTTTAAEIFDPVSRTFTPTGNTNVGRIYASSVLLPDGRALVSGGEAPIPGFDHVACAGSAEIYSPDTGAFTLTQAPSDQYGLGCDDYGPAFLLSNGKALIPSMSSGGCQLYDPLNAAFTPTGATAEDQLVETAAQLTDGQVLFSGGGTTYFFVIGDSTAVSVAQVYDPATNTFYPAANMNSPRIFHAAAPLKDGRVLVAGGFDIMGTLSSAELYTLGPLIIGASAAGRDLEVTGHNFDAEAILLVDGFKQKTLHDPNRPQTIIGKKTARKISGKTATLTVLDSNGATSPGFPVSLP